MKILHIIASVDPKGGGSIEGLLQQARERERQKIAHTHIVTLDDPAAPWRVLNKCLRWLSQPFCQNLRKG